MFAEATVQFDSLSARQLLANPEFWKSLQSAATVIALIVGGFWTYRLFVQKRQRFPRAVVTHTVNALDLPTGNRYLRVSVKVKNSGEVLVRLQDGKVWVGGLRPFEWVLERNEQINFDLRTTVCRPDEEVGWPTIASCEWSKGDEEIEPAEEEEIHFDFFIERWQTVQVYSYWNNERKRRGILFGKTKNIGWTATTIHELSLEKGDEMPKETLPRPTDQRQRPPKPPPPPRPRPATLPPERAQRPPKQPPPPPPKKGG